MCWKRKQRMPSIEGDTSCLPCEVIYNILLKLPVKSLFRFRCVCKSWSGVISEPQFVKSHLNESIKLDRQRLFGSEPWSHSFYYKGYESCDDSNETLRYPCNKYGRPSVLCSCNGLVLLRLHQGKICVLWNPSIRAYKEFSCPYIHSNYVPYGLCYDSSMDDYKVVFISDDDDDDDDEIFYVVFSFKGQCWTEARKFPYLGFHGHDMVVVNGVLHWVAFTLNPENSNSLPPKYLCNSDSSSDKGHKYEYDCTQTYVIVYYDMADDKFKEIPPPNCINGGDIFSLTVMRGCLSLYCNTIDNKYVVVWTMKQYGEQSSWTKLFLLPRWLGTRHLDYLNPLCATKKGEVVMIINGSQIIIYNPKDKKTKRLGLTKIWDSSVVLCVDSLVWPIRTATQEEKGIVKRENNS